MLEKIEGCSIVTCPYCSFKFCFKCGVDMDEVIENDNTWHKETCDFHPKNLYGEADRGEL